jgi:predicted transposase/invertase (TIGR01784 family)
MLMSEWNLEDALVVEREEGWEEGREEGIEYGLEKGREEGWEKGADREKFRIAGNLKALGLPPEQIAAATGLGPQDIAAL